MTPSTALVLVLRAASTTHSRECRTDQGWACCPCNLARALREIDGRLERGRFRGFRGASMVDAYERRRRRQEEGRT